MKEFDISDKELKALLKSDGLEEPSADFNEAVLSKIEAFEKKKTEPARAPKWILLLLGFLFIAPSAYFIFFGEKALSDRTATGLEFPSMGLAISNKFMFILMFSMLAVGMTLFFAGFLKKQSAQKSQVKKG